jgi:hypothetical protein
MGRPNETDSRRSLCPMKAIEKAGKAERKDAGTSGEPQGVLACRAPAPLSGDPMIHLDGAPIRIDGPRVEFCRSRRRNCARPRCPKNERWNEQQQVQCRCGQSPAFRLLQSTVKVHHSTLASVRRSRLARPLLIEKRTRQLAPEAARGAVFGVRSRWPTLCRLAQVAQLVDFRFASKRDVAKWGERLL